jgi:Ca2+-binding RTX toxin-like protein
VVAAGTYAESLVIDKAVTILGPNRLNDGASDDRVGEAVITGFTRVTAAAGEVTFSGLEFRYTGATNSLLASLNGGGFLTLTGNADVTIANSRFVATNPQGNSGGNGVSDGRAIMVPTNYGGDLTIADNYFGGPATNGFSGANFRSAVWSDGSAATLSITGNTFEYIRTGLNLDGYDDATSVVSGNLFTNTGSGISIGFNGDTTSAGITNNTFENVGTDFNLRNFTNPLTFNAGTNTATAGSSTLPGANHLTALGGSGNDAMTGNAGAESLAGNDGNDTLTGNDGADVLSGGAGDDSLVGGAGGDTIDGGANTDTVIVAEGATLLRNFDGSFYVIGETDTDFVRNVEFVQIGEAAPIAVTPAAIVINVTDTGADDAGDSTTSLAVSGTGRPNTNITIAWTGAGGYAEQVTVMVAADGTWSAAPESLPAGNTAVTITATQSDGLGNTGTATATVAFDAEAPDAPALDLLADSDTGTSDADDITTANAIQIAVQAEAGATVRLSQDGTLIDTKVADANGEAVFDVTGLTGGTGTDYAFTATQEDLAGRISDAGSLTVRVDDSTTAPTLDLATADDTGADSGDNVTNKTGVRITGTSEAFASIVLTREVGSNTVQVGTTTADAAGNWAIDDVQLVAGGQEGTENKLLATATDLAGNTATSSLLRVQADTQAPDPLIVAVPSQPPAVLNGTATQSIRIYFGEAMHWVELNDIEVTGLELLSFSSSGGYGAYTWVVQAQDGFQGTATFKLKDGATQDAAGNLVGEKTYTLEVDAVAPDVAVLTADDSALKVGEATTITIQFGEAISGFTLADLTATNGSLSDFTSVDGDTYTVVFTPTSGFEGDGSVTVTGEYSDAAGNVQTGGSTTVSIDTQAPATPTIDLDAASDSGSETDNLTKFDEVFLSGTAEPGASVVLTVGSSTITATVEPDGDWTAFVDALSEGSNLIEVVATDAAGNTSSNSLVVELDTAAPGAPTVGLDAGSDSGAAGDGLTNDTTPTLTGSAEPGAVVTVSLDGTELGTATADGTGIWSFALTSPLADGTYTVSATATDAAGNTGPATAFELEVDTTPPAAPELLTATLTSVGGGTLVATGTAAAFSTVALYAGGTEPVATGVAGADGNWSITVTTPLPAGSHVLTVTATDDADVTSAPSNAFTLVVGATGGVLTGGTGAETLGGFDGNDTLVATAGEADSLSGGAGLDVADYGAFDGIVAVLDAGTVEAGGKTDSVSGIEGVIGTGGGDLIFGGSASNLLEGGAGDDVLDGEGGNDTLVGGAGIDELAGGDGVDVASYASDTAGISVNLVAGSGSGGDAADDALFGIEGVIGGTGNDTLVGDGAANALAGGLGADSLDGGAAADTLTGGDGADTLRGEAGADRLDAGNGFDVVSYAGSTAVLINLSSATVVGSGGQAAGDTLIGVEGVTGGSGSDNLTGSAGDNALSGEGGNDTLTGGLGSDSLTGGAGTDRMLGEGGEDLLDGGANADSIDGGDGNDTVTGGLGNDTLAGGLGTDTLSYASASAGVTVLLSSITLQNTGGADSDQISGFENLVGSGFNDSLSGTIGDNVVSGLAGGDTLTGLTGNDTLFGGAGADSLNGHDDSDLLQADEGNDSLRGSEGNDTLLGGAGADQLSGGNGADVFRFAAPSDSTTTERDFVTDFDLAVDMIDVAAIDANALVGGNDAFAFVANGGAFTAVGQLRVIADGAERWLLQGNTDGDTGTIEFEVRIASAVTLTESNVLL